MKLLLLRRGIHVKLQAAPFHTFLRHTIVPSPAQSPREASLQFTMMKWLMLRLCLVVQEIKSEHFNTHQKNLPKFTELLLCVTTTHLS